MVMFSAKKQVNTESSQKAQLFSEVFKGVKELEKDKIAIDFASSFLASTSENTLEIFNKEKLTEVITQTYSFVKQKDKNQALKVRVYNSNKEFFFDRTIIEIATADSPFIVNSVLSALSNNGYKVYEIFHPVIKLDRNKEGLIEKVYDFKTSADDINRESIIHLQVTRVKSTKEHEQISKLITTSLNFVRISIEDWKPIVKQTNEVIKSIDKNLKSFSAQEVTEAKEFLQWIAHENFVFLGFVKYHAENKNGKKELVIDEKTRLGIFRAEEKDFVPLGLLKIAPDEFAAKSKDKNIIEVIKSLRKSIVHRSVNMDYIMIKIYNEAGEVIEENCILGLFASRVYFHNALDIPLVRGKIDYVLKDAGFRKDSHSGKALISVLQNYPKDELFQITKEELSQNARSIIELNDRPTTKIFVRKDRFSRFLSFLIFVPREYFTTDLRYKIQDLLTKEFKGQVTDYYTQLSELALARLNVILKLDNNSNLDANLNKIEKELVELTSSWVKGLRFLIENEASDDNYRFYLESFADSYRIYYTPNSAFEDIKKIQTVYQSQNIAVALTKEEKEEYFSLKIYTPANALALSEILPILQNTGFYVLDEKNFEIKPSNKEYAVWINHFRLKLEKSKIENFETLKENFELSFSKIWAKQVENDGLNKLIVLANLSYKQVEIVRLYVKYLNQISFSISTETVIDCLVKNANLTKAFVSYFDAKFNPTSKKQNSLEKHLEKLENEIKQSFELVINVNDDKILKQVFAIFKATLRTNYFQNKNYISCKIKSNLVPNLPEPKPFVEIFVYSNDFEGIHLRGGKVARGGLRWSDRKDDFRTEVLGLVKAQMVKNSVIVPVGSKGGFVVKNPSEVRGEFLEQGKSCYKTYLCGLLDITDNIIDGKIVPPIDVVRYDEDDPYLVVAADKGTATFSDIANSISEKYNFWLGDAFASGGSAGYDHKKMGITAKGGWIAVQRHFAELGIDIEKHEFSVVGIGDLSGDVFGNGMILSNKIKLIGAFNHMHIFIDPNPINAQKNFDERLRIFNLPSSSWLDYSKSLISSGGGIFERKAKTITLTKEIKTLLELEENEISPDELIKKLLCLNVDLLWNGGIGTYFKSSDESHEATGDRTNNACRVNANELKAKVIGEGGNLGFTQKARIEYALNGGKINTDAIDNSAGVDCSDHEVNIKIALFSALKSGKISLEKRNSVLSKMQDEVSDLVLKDNFEQTFAISIAEGQKDKIVDEKFALIKHLEHIGFLNSKLEFLPDASTINSRKINKIGFTRPELSVILAYSKINSFDNLVSSNFANDSYAEKILLNYFPSLMQKAFKDEILNHKLKKEIISTAAINHIINRMGATFFFRVIENKSASFTDIARCFYIINDCFNLEPLWQKLMEIDANVSVEAKLKLTLNIRCVIEKCTYWLLRNNKNLKNAEDLIENFSKDIAKLQTLFSKKLTKTYKESLEAEIESIITLGIDEKTAKSFANLSLLDESFNIIQISKNNKLEIEKAFDVYFQIAQTIGYVTFKDIINNIIPITNWEKLAKKSLEEEIEDLFMQLVVKILNESKANDVNKHLETWVGENEQKITKFKEFLIDISKQERTSNSMLIVAINKLHTLV